MKMPKNPRKGGAPNRGKGLAAMNPGVGARATHDRGPEGPEMPMPRMSDTGPLSTSRLAALSEYPRKPSKGK